MTAILRNIAQRIADPARPLSDRAQLCRWVRSSAWRWQVEAMLSAIMADRDFAAHSRN